MKKPIITVGTLHHPLKHFPHKLRRKSLTVTFLKAVPHRLAHTHHFICCLHRPIIAFDQNTACFKPVWRVQSQVSMAKRAQQVLQGTAFLRRRDHEESYIVIARKDTLVLFETVI